MSSEESAKKPVEKPVEKPAKEYSFNKIHKLERTNMLKRLQEVQSSCCAAELLLIEIASHTNSSIENKLYHKVDNRYRYPFEQRIKLNQASYKSAMHSIENVKLESDAMVAAYTAIGFEDTTVSAVHEQQQYFAVAHALAATSLENVQSHLDSISDEPITFSLY